MLFVKLHVSVFKIESTLLLTTGYQVIQVSIKRRMSTVVAISVLRVNPYSAKDDYRPIIVFNPFY